MGENGNGHCTAMTDVSGLQYALSKAKIRRHYPCPMSEKDFILYLSQEIQSQQFLLPNIFYYYCVMAETKIFQWQRSQSKESWSIPDFLQKTLDPFPVRLLFQWKCILTRHRQQLVVFASGFGFQTKPKIERVMWRPFVAQPISWRTVLILI